MRIFLVICLLLPGCTVELLGNATANCNKLNDAREELADRCGLISVPIDCDNIIYSQESTESIDACVNTIKTAFTCDWLKANPQAMLCPDLKPFRHGF